MKLQYLGTGASEGWPAVFCHCDNCERARARGGRNIRTRSQALLDGTLVLDFPADSYWHIISRNIDTRLWSAVVFTHPHQDHCYPEEFAMYRPPFAYPDGPLEIYANHVIAEQFRPFLDERLGKLLHLHEVTPFVPFRQGKYVITPLKADHARPEDGALFYAISDGTSSLLYAHDTGWFPDESWEAIKGMHFGLCSLDDTHGSSTNRHNHMSTDVCAEVREKLCSMGCADANTGFVLNHFSHNGREIYDELVPIASDLGFTVAYDGLSVEF